MYFSKIINYYLFFCFFLFMDVFSSLRLDYLLHTPLTKEEIFSSNNIKLFFNAKKNQHVLIDCDDLYQVQYPSILMGYNYTTLFTIAKEQEKVEILYKNNYIQNKITFLPFENSKGMHIKVESNSPLGIPRFLHKKIINDRMKEMLEKISKLT